jgi:hypothetical protein
MTTVRVPTAAEDAFPWVKSGLAAILCGALGLGLAKYGMEEDRTGESGEGEPVLAELPIAALPAEEPPAQEAEVAPEPATAPVLAVDVPDAPVPADAFVEPDAFVAPVAVVTAPPVGGGSHTVRRGRVAYLRCEGVPQRPGPFPCPRDEALENAVWAALDTTITTCGTLAGQGEADVVIDFDHADTPTARMRDTFASDAVRVDADAVLSCSQAALATVRTVFHPRRLMVSFRFVVE